MIDRQRKVRDAYQRLFKTQGESAKIVLKDLHFFCFADRPTFDPRSQRESDYNEGKRRVWLRLQGFLRMTDDQLAKIAEREVAYE